MARSWIEWESTEVGPAQTLVFRSHACVHSLPWYPLALLPQILELSYHHRIELHTLLFPNCHCPHQTSGDPLSSPMLRFVGVFPPSHFNGWQFQVPVPLFVPAILTMGLILGFLMDIVIIIIKGPREKNLSSLCSLSLRDRQHIFLISLYWFLTRWRKISSTCS